MSSPTLIELPSEARNEPNLAKELIEKFGLSEDHERLANTAMLALIAQANLSGQTSQKDYVERLSGFFAHYQTLVRELLDRASNTQPEEQ